MRHISSWSVAASLFCSISLANSVYEAGKTTYMIAGAGNSQVVERQLADFASRMGTAVSPAAVAPVSGSVTASIPQATAADRLAPHLKYVLEQGKPSTLPGFAAKPFGLSKGEDIIVTQKAFSVPSGSWTRVFDVAGAGDSKRIVIIHQTPERSVAWLTDKDGEVILTIKGSNASDTQVVPNADYAQLYQEQLQYWDKKLPNPPPAQVAAGSAK